MFARVLKALRLRLATRRALLNARSTGERALARAPLRRVLVLCYGNIYRSPFVAERLRSQLGDALEIRSAGFHHKSGRASPAEHVRMSADYGVTLDAHRSAQVTAADLAWADLVVLMDRHNWARLQAFGADDAKLLWLGTLTAESVEIPDPYGLSEREARAILDRLSSATAALIERLRSKS